MARYEREPSEVSVSTIRRVRRKLQLTHEEFAYGLGVTLRTVKRWEAGLSPCRGASARAILAIERVRACRVCGCTDRDCSGCIAKTGIPCHWAENDLCSACVTTVGQNLKGSDIGRTTVREWRARL